MENKKNRCEYHAKFNAEKYDRIGIRFPKGIKEKVFAYCDEKGESFNGMLTRLVEADIREGK